MVLENTLWHQNNKLAIEMVYQNLKHIPAQITHCLMTAREDYKDILKWLSTFYQISLQINGRLFKTPQQIHGVLFCS